MVPADYKDWWLAAAALTTTLTSAPLSAQQTAPVQAGIISGTAGATRSFGVPGKAGERVLYMGDSAYREERLVNETNSLTHILFLDQSSLTLGPGAEIILDEFSYDPNARQGKISLNLVKGLVRIVGGDISKTNETLVKTPTGTIGIRGGIATAEVNGNNASATFLFGQQMTVTDNSGNTTNITRPGFGSSLGGGGLGPTTRTDPNTLRNTLSRLGGTPGNSGTTGGNTNPPPAPGGNLISTGNGGNPQAPGSTLSPDRLQSTVTDNNAVNTTRTLQNILGSGQTPNQS